LAERLGVPATTLSFHLAQLANAGLVVQRREGRSIIYSAAYSRMNDLLTFMTENCCGTGQAGCATACTPACVEGEAAEGVSAPPSNQKRA
jgi:ArsR family transcriptional regulator